jgi:hypothetical protein
MVATKEAPREVQAVWEVLAAQVVVHAAGVPVVAIRVVWWAA